ncbi:unnamed protein product, partial [Meganyctiphanes norvegica]
GTGAMQHSRSSCMSGGDSQQHRSTQPLSGGSPEQYGESSFFYDRSGHPPNDNCGVSQGSIHNVDVCSATNTRPAYGRGVISWNDGRAQAYSNVYRAPAASCGSLDTGLGPLDPLLPHQIPQELEEHLRTCRCTCDHMGYGNYEISQKHASS